MSFWTLEACLRIILSNASIASPGEMNFWTARIDSINIYFDTRAVQLQPNLIEVPWPKHGRQVKRNDCFVSECIRKRTFGRGQKSTGIEMFWNCVRLAPRAELKNTANTVWFSLSRSFQWHKNRVKRNIRIQSVLNSLRHVTRAVQRGVICILDGLYKFVGRSIVHGVVEQDRRTNRALDGTGRLATLRVPANEFSISSLYSCHIDTSDENMNNFSVFNMWWWQLPDANHTQPCFAADT